MNNVSKKKKEITIFIPTYNRSHTLRDALDSIFSQWSDVFEYIDVVISDDASPDNTKSIVESYMKKYDNIFYYRNEKNLRFFNTVHISDYIHSKYILFLADDDCLTKFSLSNILEIIKKTNFDILFHMPKFSEKLNQQPAENSNTFYEFPWIQEYLNYLHVHEKWYKHLISYFSFYSAVMVKTDYRLEWIKYVDEAILRSNSFPHEFLHYFDLKNKAIVIPNNTFVLWRLLNESYPWSKSLIKEFDEVMNYIEKQNWLKYHQSWISIKKTCVRWRSRTILLWIWIKNLRLNYKKNSLLKKLYFLYKRFFQ